MVQFFSSSILVPYLFPLAYPHARNLVELKYVAGHDLLQRNHWSRFELAGCPALST
jgi:hypothetical protein